MSMALQIAMIILVTGMVLVNGWTDAPNAIAGAVATKALPYRKAVWLAAVCNLLGLLIISLFNSSVADTITGMADFGGDASKSFAALLSAMATVVVFAAAAWRFGIPTSESHALVAAITGAALSMGGSVRADSWRKVLAGLFISLFAGFFSGFLFSKLLGGALQKLSPALLDRFQVFSTGVIAFMHGAQDGQKFVAVFVIAEMLAKGRYVSGPVNLREHLPVLFLCAAVMMLGTSVGGKRIIDTVGTKMVALKKHHSVCADLGSGLCLLFASLAGVPMSTTHTKTTAIMGTGASDGKSQVDFKVMGGMFFAWAVTFPVCGALGFIFTRLILMIF